MVFRSCVYVGTIEDRKRDEERLTADQPETESAEGEAAEMIVDD